MGVSLSYRTSEPVPPSIRATILAETLVLAGSHDWGCEAFNLWESEERDGRLEGWCNIFLLSYPATGGGYVIVPPEESDLLAWRDARVILNALCDWSTRFGIGWDIGLAGEPIGRIIAGGLDNRLAEYMTGFGAGLFDTTDPALEEWARAVSAKHAARW